MRLTIQMAHHIRIRGARWFRLRLRRGNGLPSAGVNFCALWRLASMWDAGSRLLLGGSAMRMRGILAPTVSLQSSEQRRGRGVRANLTAGRWGWYLGFA